MQQIDDEAGTEQDAAATRKAFDDALAAVAADPTDEAAAQRLADVAARVKGTAAPSRAEDFDISVDVERAGQLLLRGQSEQAELVLRRYLAGRPNDPEAMRLMAKIAADFGFLEDSIKILRRSLEINAERVLNWIDLAKSLHQQARKSDTPEHIDEAIVAIDRAIALDPTNEEAVAYKAALYVQVRKLEAGQATFKELLDVHPDTSTGWMNYSYLLKTLGKFGESVAGYRAAVGVEPTNGGAWWGMANLKRARFFDHDIDAMLAALPRLPNDHARVAMNFALATAYDQRKDYESASRHLRDGNALRLKMHPHDIDAMRSGSDELIATYTPQFFKKRAGQGNPSKAPIFVVSMPRSGSTLVEQILASHPAIEGTEELFAIQQLQGEITERQQAKSAEAALKRTDLGDLDALGARYLELTAFHRSTDRPHFTDKNPGNWRQSGLIHTILPNAKIVDIRRNPLDCCLANYAQHFSWGVNYSYGIEEMASFYREYLRVMRHFDTVMPGVVHRVIYEDLIEDLEGEVRKLLDFLEVEFDERCLRFFETDRPVHTPSAEQVRQPINKAGFGRWQKYKPWLGELEDALGSAVEDWRR
ncbi:sulfotransferase [Sphingomonas sabuli]|uniref:Sulfotransferase n=1 Tax=Sphingomonas sabuli TaxID=2764186 RepID=A0A7G9L3B6_9SPHN|nr:tetratricopeptide repeat-containing sulfotransferase family protein [Sphingomonas sabuli]QNM83115.1 sulfotransferase [Sphingomonas sabuli]